MTATAWPGAAAQRRHHVRVDAAPAARDSGKVDRGGSVWAVAQPGRLASHALAAGAPGAYGARTPS
jgi:hypothetical protein